MSTLPRMALIVEDDPETTELVAGVLRRMGLTVCMVSSGAEAIVALERQLFSFVLLDHHLPDGPSWPVLDAARNAKKRVPVIVASGTSGDAVVAEAILRGAADYVVKTGNFWQKLPAAVQRLLTRSEKDVASIEID